MSRYNSYYPGACCPQPKAQDQRSTQKVCAVYRQSETVAPDRPCHDLSLPIAMAYVPWQVWQEVYDPATGLTRGTIFPCLDLPFLAYKEACRK